VLPQKMARRQADPIPSVHLSGKHLKVASDCRRTKP
jgi:hypothetical protein